MPNKMNKMNIMKALLDEDAAVVDANNTTTNELVEKPPRSRKVSKRTKHNATEPPAVVGSSASSSTTTTTGDASVKGIKKSTDKRSNRGTFGCYIKRAVRNAGTDNVIYRMDHSLVGVLDQLVSTYIQAAARETQSALDLMHLKQFNLASLTFALNRITPKSIMANTLEKIKRLNELLDVNTASKTDAGIA